MRGGKVGSTNGNIRYKKRGKKEEIFPGALPIRGTVVFQIRGNASNQQTRWILDRGIEMNCAKVELVEQPFPAHRPLTHQNVCSLRDPGETRGLLAEWSAGLWNIQGTSSRGLGPIHLSLPVKPGTALSVVVNHRFKDSCATAALPLPQVSSGHASFVGETFAAP